MIIIKSELSQESKSNIGVQQNATIRTRTHFKTLSVSLVSIVCRLAPSLPPCLPLNMLWLNHHCTGCYEDDIIEILC